MSQNEDDEILVVDIWVLGTGICFFLYFWYKPLSPSHILIEASSKVHLIIFLVLYGLSLASLVDYTDLHFDEKNDKIIYVVPKSASKVTKRKMLPL